MRWSVLLVVLSFTVRTHVSAVTIAAGMRHDSSSLPHAINRVGERAAHGRTVRLPKTFLAGASGSPDTQGKQFSFTFSHGDLADGNSTVPALHFGVDKLQAALRAAIDAASGGPAIQAPGASFNATFNELEMAVWPAPSDPTPLVLTSADYTTLLQILLKDTEENPGYHTLYSGLIKDPDGVVRAHLGIIAPLQVVEVDAAPVNALNNSTATQATPFLSPSRHLTTTGAPDNRWDFANLVLFNLPEPVDAAVSHLPTNELHNAILRAMSSLRLSLQVAMNSDRGSLSSRIPHQCMSTELVMVRGIGVEFSVRFLMWSFHDEFSELTRGQGLALAQTLTRVMRDLRPGEQPNGYVVPQSNDVYMIANFGVYYYTSSTVQPARDECINTEDASDAGPGGGQATGQGGSGSNGASTMGNAGDTQSAGSFPNQAAHPPPAGGGCGAGPRVDPTLDETWGRGARWPWRTTPRPRACAFWQTCITIFKRGQ